MQNNIVQLLLSHSSYSWESIPAKLMQNNIVQLLLSYYGEPILYGTFPPHNLPLPDTLRRARTVPDFLVDSISLLGDHLSHRHIDIKPDYNDFGDGNQVGILNFSLNLNADWGIVLCWDKLPFSIEY